MITDAQFEEWLRSSTAQRVTLYEADVLSADVEVTRRIANRAYTGDADTPYTHAVAKDVVVVDAITRDGGARLSVSQMAIWNVKGERDSWLDDVWTGRELRAYIGDMRWPIADFRQVFTGVMKRVMGDEKGTQILIDLRDITERINVPVSDLLMDDGSLWPLTFGEAPNITPRLRNPDTGQYTFHPTATEDVIEARVEAKPRTTITKQLTSGSFTFQTAVAGAVTASVQGDKTGGIYRNTIGALVRLLVTAYGQAGERFTEAEIDGASFDAFEASHPQAVGLYLPERTSVIEACHRLAKSVQAHLVPSRLGKLRMVQYGIPATSSGSLTENDYVSLQRGEPHPIAAAVKILYARNYTVQSSLQTSIPLEHKEIFAREWRAATATDAPTATRHKLPLDPKLADETCLLNFEDAMAEAERRLAQDKLARVPYMIDGNPVTMLLELGKGVTVYGRRYGMNAGKLGQVTMTSLDLGTYRTMIEVTV